MKLQKNMEYLTQPEMCVKLLGNRRRRPTRPGGGWPTGAKTEPTNVRIVNHNINIFLSEKANEIRIRLEINWQEAFALKMLPEAAIEYWKVKLP